jgi:hypothetical protein
MHHAPQGRLLAAAQSSCSCSSAAGEALAWGKEARDS